MAKNPRGNLFQKLQELKEWQSKQQERLFGQEKDHQEMLKRQQKQTMESRCFRRMVEIEEQNPASLKDRPLDCGGDDNHDQLKTRKSALIEEINHPESDTSCVDKENNPGNVSLDDIPVKSAKRDFKELLEERLQREGSVINSFGNNKSKFSNKPKREFLKKGEGLKRFRMKARDEFLKNQPSKNSTTRASVLNTAVSSTKGVEAAVSFETGSSKGNEASKASKKHVLSAASLYLEKQRGDESLNVRYESQNSDSSTWADVLSLKSKKQNEKKIPVVQANMTSVMKIRESPKKGKHESEDLKVYELLEQMAEDSSFCSTSSTLLGFMESPVISTPLKAILERKEKIEASQGTFPNHTSKQLPFGMDISEDNASSKDDFDSSSESCYSECEKPTINVGVGRLPPGTSRVRFSNHVEKREFDPGIEDSSLQESLSMAADPQFKDTEVWSDHSSDSCNNSHDDEPTVTPTFDAENEKYKKTSSTLPLDKDVTNLGSSTQSENGKNIGEGRYDSSGIVFKSELLHKRLLELEHEIETFRRDNEELARRKNLQEQEEAHWLKEKCEIEKKFKEKEDMLKNIIVEERKKLNREKQVFEMYCKELRNQPTKQEREEIQNLQKKLVDLQQELRHKESRNSAAQTRISNRLKSLEKENLELKEEIEKLKKEKQLESKKHQSRFSRSRSVSNTKSLHAINQQLTQIQASAADSSIVIHDVVPTKPIPPCLLLEGAKSRGKGPSKMVKLKGLPPKRNSTSDVDHRSSFLVNHKGVSLRRIQSVPNLVPKAHASASSLSDSLNDTDTNESNGQGKEHDIVEGDADIGEEIQDFESQSGNTVFSGERTDPGKMIERLTAPNISMPKFSSSEKQMESEMTSSAVFDAARDALYPKDKISHQNIVHQSKVPSASAVYPIEKVNFDGSREIRFGNGNFKRISPDGLVTKLFYFNGDVKENLADGTIKYYYSETRTWHTTFPDGLEVLEFPNGQVERHIDGTTEVSFPDGTVRLLHQNGREEVILPDGTTATTEPNGEKVIQLPNGQKEFQTKDYMVKENCIHLTHFSCIPITGLKRIYPDGTVKIVYSDGVQETRYANGRVRLRDPSGSLVMDSES